VNANTFPSIPRSRVLFHRFTRSYLSIPVKRICRLSVIPTEALQAGSPSWRGKGLHCIRSTGHLQLDCPIREGFRDFRVHRVWSSQRACLRTSFRAYSLQLKLVCSLRFILANRVYFESIHHVWPILFKPALHVGDLYSSLPPVLLCAMCCLSILSKCRVIEIHMPIC
jgi:hypothetical protein